MKILTLENSAYDLDSVPNEVDDLRYCVFDAGDTEFQDYYWLPLIFLESFHAPAICLNIGEYTLQMPMDWSIITSDEDFGGIEVIPLASLNNRGFVTPIFNPMKSWMPQAAEIQITNVFQDVKWFFPKLKNGHLLVVPLEDKPEPKCAMFVKEANKVKDMDIADML
jgi:hypothetical protein